LALTEIGVTVEDAGSQAEQAQYVRSLFDLMTGQVGKVAFFCYFAWKDNIGHQQDGRFGLIEPNGEWRPAGEAFQDCCGGPQDRTETVRFDHGFGEWAAREGDLLGTPVENESAPFSGLAMQRTSRGLLIWANLPGVAGGAFVFEDFSENRRLLWRLGTAHSEEVAVPASDTGPVFAGGFSVWNANEPTLLGMPLHNESGPVAGLALQRTDRGLLIWANLAGVDGGAFVFQSLAGDRRAWHIGDASSRSV
jgi:hypothetical protein